ncbi:MAG TPA: permease [Thermoleophilaceae bacterium]
MPLWVVGTAFWLAVLAVVAARGAGVPENETLATFGVIFTSIVVEALPFILLGAAASAAIAVWVPSRTFARVSRLPGPLQVPVAAAAGFAMPVCECGSVPVARRLILRGLSPSAGIAFMLAAPILNPIVLASTWVAYGAAGKAVEMTAARAGLGLVVAVLAGALIGRGAGGVVREREEHVELHEHAGGFVEHLADDFVFMGRFVVVGAAVAALLQTVVPQEALSAVADRPVLGALALMGLAMALSLCSEADAFVAVSFTAFPLGSQLAFLVLGPVADAKLAVLYGATFHRRFVLQVVAIAAPVALGGALLFDEVFG